MHRTRSFSILVGSLLALAVAGCGDDGGVPGGSPDASPSIDAPPGEVIDAMPGGDTTPPIDGTPPIDATIVTGVVINEVVLFPQNDWSGGDFLGPIGDGTVSTLDQFVEIQNRSGEVVSLIGWKIDVIDSSSGEIESTPLLPDEEEDVTVAVTPGSSFAALQPGHFLVLGNPQGSISTDAYIMLKDTVGNIIDDLEVGVRDRAGDGDDGAPGPGENGFSRGNFDEAIARPDGQADTDNDRADFIKMFATPLAANVNPARNPGDTTPPNASAPADANDWPVTRALEVVFNEPLDAAVIGTSSVSLSVNGQNRPVSRLSFADFDRRLRVETVGALPFGASATVTVDGSVTDYAGNALGSDEVIDFQTEDAPPNNADVIITEICVEAQQDWNHSGGGGMPFSNTPGPNTSSISSSDEWIELRVLSGPVDLTGYTVEIFNGPNIDGPSLEITELDEDRVFDQELRFFGAGASLTSVPAGAHAVVGNPTGSMNDDVYVVLRDASGQILDEVEIGGNEADVDRGGDGLGNGAPESGANGESNTVDDETVARVTSSGDPVDTGGDIDDWNHSFATLGAPNP